MSDELLQRAKVLVSMQEAATECRFDMPDHERNMLYGNNCVIRDLIAEIERLQALIPPTAWASDGRNVTEVRKDSD
jgi:hypothetical protein